MVQPATMSSLNQEVEKPSLLPVNYCNDEFKVKREYIINVVQAFSEIAVSFESDYSYIYCLQRCEQRFVNLSFIVSSSVLADTLSGINNSKTIIITDNCKNHHMDEMDDDSSTSNVSENSSHKESFLLACKRTFGNWKIEFMGTEKEVTELATCLLYYQVKIQSYITLDITKSDYSTMMSHDEFWNLRRSITFVPTGYDGLSINLDIDQENIRETVHDLLYLFNSDPHMEKIPPEPLNRMPMPLYCSDTLENREMKRFNKRPLEFIKPSQSQEKIIQLNKQEVAFLLGRNGERIASIRNQSGCMIYILPIAKQIEILSKKKTPQLIKLVGTRERINVACTIIETNLILFKENNSHFL